MSRSAARSEAGATMSFIDLFAGVGGFTLGFRGVSAGDMCDCAPRLMVDIDRSARRVAVRNMPNVPYLTADIHELSGTEIRSAAGLAVDEPLHVLLGGPPCQGFSFLGKRALEDERNLHVVDFLRLVKELRPLAVVMENVPLIITGHDGAVIREVCAALSDQGYASCADVLTASEYGVPQVRRRAFVLAYHRSVNFAPELPKRTHERTPAASELVAGVGRRRFEPSKHAYVSVGDAIGDLPPLDAGQGEEVMSYADPPTSEYQRWAREGSIAVFNHRARSHSREFLKKISVIREGSRNQELPDGQRFSDNYYSQAYARLHRHGLSNTVTTSFGNPGSGRFMHYRDLRSITVREAARLQSFPDTFVFDGDLSTQMRHVGNAVPPLLARAIRDQVVQDILHCVTGGRTEAGKSRPRRTEDPAQRSRTMRAVPSKNTSAELALRKALVAAGLRGYRLHCKGVPGNPDVVFTRAKVAVFVDGCFWHGCPKCYRKPISNKTYWRMKVQHNRDRDIRVSAECKEAGWRVVRVWEHEVLSHPERAARKVGRALRTLRRK